MMNAVAGRVAPDCDRNLIDVREGMCMSAVKYHIDTIPVWDAMKLDGECFLCALRRKTELGEVERYLGASVMEPDVRIQVNRKGFCRDHQRMLYTMDNRLGHALMLESHVSETRERLDKLCKQIRHAARGASGSSILDRITGKTPSPARAMEDAVAGLEALTETCIVCDSIADNMGRYLHTFFHLYQNDTDFRKRFEGSKGMCIPHAAELLKSAPQELGSHQLAAFADTVCRLTTENFDRMQEDISWFCRKFDYRYFDEPWKNSRDAVERTVNKLRGWCVGTEPNPKK